MSPTARHSSGKTDGTTIGGQRVKDNRTPAPSLPVSPYHLTVGRNSRQAGLEPATCPRRGRSIQLSYRRELSAAAGRGRPCHDPLDSFPQRRRSPGTYVLIGIGVAGEDRTHDEEGHNLPPEPTRLRPQLPGCPLIERQCALRWHHIQRFHRYWCLKSESNASLVLFRHVLSPDQRHSG